MKTISCIFLTSVFVAGALPQERKLEWPEMRALVGPEEGVYMRGESRLSGGTATVVLPSAFESFTKPAGRTVQITCINGFSPLSVSRVTSGQFTVSTSGQGNASQAFFWEVKAECASPPAFSGAGNK